jgi:hypothetical protein
MARNSPRIILWFSLFWALAFVADLKGNDPATTLVSPGQKAYGAQPLPVNQADSKAWVAATKDLDYKVEKPKPKPKPKEENDPPSQPMQNPDWFKDIPTILTWLLYIFLGSIVLYLLYRMFVADPDRNVAVQFGDVNFDRMIEERLLETNVRPFILQATDAGQYNLAVRLLYLDYLKAMHQADLVAYDVSKTNHTYAMELKDLEQRKKFRFLARKYEGFWYGLETATVSEFNELQAIYSKI